MLIGNIIKVLVLVILIFFINGCSSKSEYINQKSVLFKRLLDIEPKINLEWNTRHKYNQFRQDTKNLTFDGYDVKYLKIKPYFARFSDVNEYSQIIALCPEYSYYRSMGWKKTEKHKRNIDPYTFMLFTLNKTPLEKKLLAFFNTINKTYETQLDNQNINRFVKYDCDKNIKFSKYEMDKDFKPLVSTCYAKRLDKDVFLITRFAHPNTQKDKKLFKTEIIPTILKSIKVTPTKLSPWKYY